jgi:hypothetical protein
MKPTTSGPRTQNLNDPRLREDFNPALWPQCDHGDLPANAEANASTDRKLAFLAAYYALNLSYSRLVSVRAAAHDAEEERKSLQAIESALLARDALDDKYAPVGIVASPDFENGFVRNVNFVQPQLPRVGSSLTMLFAVRPKSVMAQ